MICEFGRLWIAVLAVNHGSGDGVCGEIHIKCSYAQKFSELCGGGDRGLQDGIDRIFISGIARGRHGRGVSIGADGAVGCVHLPGAGQLYGHDQSGLFFYNHGQNFWVPARDRLKDRISIPVEQAVLLALAD